MGCTLGYFFSHSYLSRYSSLLGKEVPCPFSIYFAIHHIFDTVLCKGMEPRYFALCFMTSPVDAIVEAEEGI